MNSNRSYLVNAIYNWCIDNAFTPQIVVDVQYTGVKVPKQFVMGRKMVLNISPKAIKELSIDVESIEFYANFNQRVEKISMPIEAVLAVYAYENGEGITFDEEEELPDEGDSEGGYSDMSVSSCDNDAIMINKTIPRLTIIK